MRKTGSLLLYFFLGLVIVGLATQLIKSPGQFITSILILLGVSFIIFIILRAVLNKRQGPTDPEMKKYKQAVKKSQDKHGKPVTYKQVKKSKDKPGLPKKRKRKRRSSHLKVIEGNKKRNIVEDNKKINLDEKNKKDSNK